MVRFRIMKYFALLALAAACCLAQDAARADAEGCTDSPLVARFPGSHIADCDHKEFESKDLPVARDKDENEVDKAIEGEYFFYDFAVRGGLSQVQLLRNFQAALNEGRLQDRLCAIAGLSDGPKRLAIRSFSIRRRLLLPYDHQAAGHEAGGDRRRRIDGQRHRGERPRCGVRHPF